MEGPWAVSKALGVGKNYRESKRQGAGLLSSFSAIASAYHVASAASDPIRFACSDLPLSFAFFAPCHVWGLRGARRSCSVRVFVSWPPWGGGQLDLKGGEAALPNSSKTRILFQAFVFRVRKAEQVRIQAQIGSRWASCLSIVPVFFPFDEKWAALARAVVKFRCKPEWRRERIGSSAAFQREPVFSPIERGRYRGRG